MTLQSGQSRQTRQARQTGQFARQLLRNPSALLAVIILLLAVVLGLFADHLAPFSDHYEDPQSQDGAPGVIDRSTARVHWFGTDDLGRDIFSRLLYAMRVSLAVGLVAAAIIVFTGTLIGLIAGYCGGLVDNVLMRLTDVIYAFPSLLFVLVLVATFGRSVGNILLALGLVNWPMIARVVRGQVKVTRETDYVLSARSVGVTPRGIVFRHILPNVIGTIIVLTTLILPALITAEASLAFLGVGIDPSIPTLGTMINASLVVLYAYPSEVFFPVAALALLTLAFTLLGDAVRDALDFRA